MLVLLLLVTLVISGVLTFQGSEAARLHKQTVERLLRDHAASAAGRYAEQAEMDISGIVRGLFQGYDKANPTFDAASFAPLALDPRFIAQCGCDPEPHVDYHFAYDYGADRFYYKKGRAPEADEVTLRGILLDIDNQAKLVAGVKFATGGQTRLHRPGAFVAVVPRDPAGKPTIAVGFVGKPAILTGMLTPAADFNKKLWTAYEPKPDRFQIEVTDAGSPIYSGEVPESEYSASASLPPAFGTLKVTASINPRDVPLVAGSDVSKFRGVPMFVSLMALSALLLIAILFLFRRESELAEARSNFVAGVSHELRTPLAQIRMFTETLLLGRTRNDAERRRSLEIIDQEAKRLTALVDNVLNLGRAERGTVRLAPAAVELSPIVKEVVDTFSQLPRARSMDFRTELEPRLIATVDSGAFRQILLNLLDNAAKYGPSSQRITVGLAMFEENARLWVDDEGPGIPVRERQRIFEPFFRSATHGDSRVSGSGIGLAVVRELSLLLGGTVRAEQAPGGGARIVVEFPDAYLRPEEAASSTAVA